RKRAVLVSFVKSIPGTYDPLTDTTQPGVDETIEGLAIEVPDDPELYAQLDLLRAQVVTLFFVPTLYGDNVPLHSNVSWAGKDRTVKEVIPIRPDGNLLAATV